jgi:hypothetical protein
MGNMRRNMRWNVLLWGGFAAMKMVKKVNGYE